MTVKLTIVSTVKSRCDENSVESKLYTTIEADGVDGIKEEDILFQEHRRFHQLQEDEDTPQPPTSTPQENDLNDPF